MNAQTQREEDIFDAARLIKNPRERQSFLERSCRGDAALRERIEQLLAVESEAEAFFSGGAIAREELETLPEFSFTDSASTTFSTASRVVGEEPIGTKIGRYKLLQKIGEGGCGVVYMAEQEEPVRRRVALKIIKLGMETKSVIARFEAERQALAMMDHPNIAHVFDAGATDRGPPYFVMELVRGVKITEYCDRGRLGNRARLDLFIQVCHAIQHAHQKGIIHGDIKPSNILVTLHDGVAVPKVIDFGISKATEARLTDKMFTAYAQLIGTPAYMSPEQTDITGVDVDTRSDIYSLGVLLYELLTGRTPFEAKELLAGGLDEMRRILREKEAPRPSTRMGALPIETQFNISVMRSSEPHVLMASLRGDLDWVVMKALEKDRARRYETANGLAVDVQRYVNNEPVLARPPSRVYRFRKLVRRNRVVFAATGAVAAALVAGMSTSTWLFLREREARQRAVAAEQQQAQLRHDAELRERITQAALFVTQEKFNEADHLISHMTFREPSVEAARVLRAVGEWHAVQNRWADAADRFSRLLEINELDGSDAATLDSLRCGPALVESGDEVGYEKFRSEQIARYSGAPCAAADRIVKISLLLPADAKILASLSNLEASNTKGLAEAEATGDVFQASWRTLSEALFLYRSGNYTTCIRACARGLAYPEFNAPRTATMHLIRALAETRLGQIDAARVDLTAAREILSAKTKTMEDRGTPIQGFWFDWAFARILLRESAESIDSALHG
ncbi:MAG TPA: serine/threonine-protein kinase [Opitutaceae bacterium]|nr:serine/threonine-protein kinase [Opitutaceae bacterium]